MPPRSTLHIDDHALRHNARIVQGLLRDAAPPGQPPPHLCAVVKADAYGAGLPFVAPALRDAGVERFAVYAPDEAAELLRLVPDATVLVMMPVSDPTGMLDEGANDIIEAMRDGRLHFSVHSHEQADSLVRAATSLQSRLPGLAPLPLHIDIDTGMTRGGAPPDEALRTIAMLRNSASVRIAGVSSHFASADCDEHDTTRQADAFDRVLAAAEQLLPGDCVIHQANSFGAFRSPRHHRGMVRVGLALLGYGCEEFCGGEFRYEHDAATLRPALRWMTTLVHIAHAPAGRRVGYGGAHTLTRDSVLGIAPVGYADGYPRSVGDRAVVRIDCGAAGFIEAPVVGRVSMDQIAIDLTDIPRECARTGAMVEVFGADPAASNYLPTLAARAGTITHDLLCRIDARVHRCAVISQTSQAPAAPRIDAPKVEIHLPASHDAARRLAV